MSGDVIAILSVGASLLSVGVAGLAMLHRYRREQKEEMAALRADFNARFEKQEADSNARFEKQEADSNARFEKQSAEFDARFEKQSAEFDAKFEKQEADSNARFEKQSAEFDALAAKVAELIVIVQALSAEVKANRAESDRRFKEIMAILRPLPERIARLEGFLSGPFGRKHAAAAEEGPGYGKPRSDADAPPDDS